MLRAKLETLLQLGQVFRNENLNNFNLLDNQLKIFSAHLNDIIITLSEHNSVLLSNNDDTAQLISILSLLKKDLENLKRYRHYSSSFWSLTPNQKNYLENPLPLLVGSLNKLELYLIKETLNALLTIGEEFSGEVSRIFNEYKFSSYTELQQQPNLLNETIKTLNTHFKKLLGFLKNNENTLLVQYLNSAKFSFEHLQHFITHTYNEALAFYYYPKFWPASPFSRIQKELINEKRILFDNSLNSLKQKFTEDLKNPNSFTYSPSHNVQ